jgi:DNA repair exonuclease SbcCD ATPase subunit
MKYIKKIILENFQSHKYSVVEFDNQLNVIVGPSDSGKSAIIRGLKWALYNEPQGDYFIREGEKECSVTVEFSDGTNLKRYRSSSKNSYTVKKNTGEEIKYEGFGVNVPEEILEVIGIKKIYLDSELSTSINLGEQLEGAFLLSEKNSTKASAIGRLIGVNIIDDALRETLKDTRALNSRKRVLEESVSKLTDEIQAYNYLEDLKNTYKKIIDIKSQIHQYDAKLKKLNNLKDKIIQVYKDKQNTTELIANLSNVDKLMSQINLVENKILKHRYLNNYKTSLEKIKREKSENDITLMKLVKLEETNLIADRLDKDISRYNTVFTFINRYRQIKTEINKLDIAINKLSTVKEADECINEVSNKINQYSKLLDKNQRYINVRSSLYKGNIYLNKLSRITELEGIINILDNKYNMLIKCNKLYEELFKNRSEIEYQTKYISNATANLDIEIENYQKLLEEIEICPFCMSEIDDSKINHILNHYIGG